MGTWGVGRQAVTVIRRDFAARGLDGRFEEGSPSTFAITGTVNPVPGDILNTLPEGERVEKQLRLLTDAELRTSDDYEQTRGDLVIVRGEIYEVRDVAIYEKVIRHYEYRIRRVRPNIAEEFQHLLC